MATVDSLHSTLILNPGVVAKALQTDEQLYHYNRVSAIEYTMAFYCLYFLMHRATGEAAVEYNVVAEADTADTADLDTAENGD